MSSLPHSSRQSRPSKTPRSSVPQTTTTKTPPTTANTTSSKKSRSDKLRSKNSSKLSANKLDDVTNTALLANNRHFASGFDKKLTFKAICDEFTTWRAWQRRVLLCGCTERSARSLLQVLSTVVEPLFHRDYQICSHGEYPSHLMKPIIVSGSSEASETRKKSKAATNTTVAAATITTTTTAGENTATHAPDTSAFTNEPESDQICATSATTTGDIEGAGEAGESQHFEPIVRHPMNIDVGYEMQPHRNATHESKSSRNIPRVASKSDSKAFASKSSSKLDEFDVEPKCIHHAHAQPKRKESDISLDAVCCECRNVVAHGDGDCSGATKHRNLGVGASGGDARKLNLPEKSVPLVSFKVALKTAFSHYMTWSNAERGDFFLDLLNICSQDDLSFFAQCIVQRLGEISDVNRMPNKMFLKVFSYLNISSLVSCAQVCTKWKALANHQSLWKSRCYDLATENDQIEIIKKICAYSNSINWKKVYIELCVAIREIKREQIQQATTDAEEKLRREEAQKAADAAQAAVDNATIIAYLLGHTDASQIDPAHLQQMIIEEAGKDSDDAEDMKPLDRGEVEASDDDEENEPGMEAFSSGSLHMLADELKQVSSRNLEQDEVAADVRHELIQAENKLNFDGGVQADENYVIIPILGVKSLKRVRKLQGHEEPVLCLQFDSKRVMTGSADRSVRMWDVRTGRNFHKLKGHKGGVRCLQFDDKFIVTGSWDTTVMIWEVTLSFKLLHTISHHKGCVSCLEMNKDILVTGSHDYSVCVWERETWKLLSSTRAHKGAVLCLSIISVETSNDQLLTGSTDRSIKLWEIESMKLLRSFENHDSAVLTVKLCGNLIASGTTSGHVTFWNISSGEKQGAILAHQGPVYTLCFLVDKFITGGGDHLVRQWDLGTCTCIRSLTGHKGAVLCVRASQKRIVSASSDGSTRIWDLVANLQQAGGFYDDMNKNVLSTRVIVKQGDTS